MTERPTKAATWMPDLASARLSDGMFVPAWALRHSLADKPPQPRSPSYPGEGNRRERRKAAAMRRRAR